MNIITHFSNVLVHQVPDYMVVQCDLLQNYFLKNKLIQL